MRRSIKEKGQELSSFLQASKNRHILDLGFDEIDFTIVFSHVAYGDVLGLSFSREYKGSGKGFWKSLYLVSSQLSCAGAD